MYSFNSLLVNLNDFSVILYFILKCKKLIVINGINWHENDDNVVFYYTYIYNIVWSVLYTFSGLLDIQIVYSRIQMFYLKLNFIRNQPVYK